MRSCRTRVPIRRSGRFACNFPLLRYPGGIPLNRGSAAGGVAGRSGRPIRSVESRSNNRLHCSGSHDRKSAFSWAKTRRRLTSVPPRTTAVHRLGDSDVTIDKSLRRKGRLARARNVLKRDERIAQLQTEERWTPGRSVLGLPKVRIIKTAAGKKKKKKAAEEADTTAAAAEATPAAAGKGAPAKAAGTPRPQHRQNRLPGRSRDRSATRRASPRFWSASPEAGPHELAHRR